MVSSAKKNMVVLETRSILYAARYAGSRYLGRLLILTIFRWCWRSAKDAQICFAFSHASNLVWLQGSFVLSFRWIPSELKFSDKEGRSLDRDYDPSKSLLHVLAQRVTRSSLARANGQDWLSLSLTDLDVGAVDVTSHVHVPTVIAQSYAPSDDPSDRVDSTPCCTHIFLSLVSPSRVSHCTSLFPPAHMCAWLKTCRGRVV